MAKTKIMKKDKNSGYILALVLNEETGKAEDGVVGVSFKFGDHLFRNIFMFYNPIKNVFENESGQPILNPLQFLSVKQRDLAKIYNKWRKTFSRMDYPNVGTIIFLITRI